MQFKLEVKPLESQLRQMRLRQFGYLQMRANNATTIMKKTNSLEVINISRSAKDLRRLLQTIANDLKELGLTQKIILYRSERKSKIYE